MLATDDYAQVTEILLRYPRTLGDSRGHMLRAGAGIVLALALAISVAGCTTPSVSHDGGGSDAGTTDVGQIDGGGGDTGGVDGGGVDAGPMGALTVVGGFGSASSGTSPGATITVVGQGFGVGAAACTAGGLCVVGGFSR